MSSERVIGVRSDEFQGVVERVRTATRLSSRLSSYTMDDADALRAAFEELIGKPVGERFTLIPPFYTDYGLNITVGDAVFIGYDCMFTGHGPVDIGDEVMIAAKVKLVTVGHPLDPATRRATSPSAPSRSSETCGSAPPPPSCPA